MEEKEFSFEERVARCALNSIFGFEPRKGKMLIDAAGGAFEVFSTPKDELSQILGAGCRMQFLDRITEQTFDAAAMELEMLGKDGCRFICLGEDCYPQLLTECQDPPLGLYYKGVSPPGEVFTKREGIAVVGTRSPSAYGKEWCRRIVDSFSRCPRKPVVVSGLALGIDGLAHKTALEEGLPTIAVMATGIDRLYPPANRGLGESIAATPGCGLITDYPPGTDAIRINFLRRNRIIAGIAGSTVLIESKIKGGGMMTARLAFSYDREVYALPGRIDDLRSQGCNYLIKGNMAEAVTDCGSFLDSLGLTRGREGFRECRERRMEAVLDGKLAGSSEDVATILLLVKRNRGIDLDELVRRSGLEYKRVSALVTALEEEGIIGIDLLRRCRIL